MNAVSRPILNALLLCLSVGAAAHGQGVPIDLQALIAGTAAGDTLRLAAGRYTAAVVDRPLTLLGRGDDTVIDGGGRGHSLSLKAADITVARLRITGSGTDIDRKESGVWIDRDAPRARLEQLVIEARGFGIWADAATAPRIAGCRITGRDDEAMVSDLGNGIHLFKVSDGLVRDNHISKGRDGIYISNSTGCLIADNHISDTRFAIHYMYSHTNRVVGNRAEDSSVGLALMYSKHLEISANRVSGCHTHGILLRNLYYSRIVDNWTGGNKDGFFFSGCSYDTLSGNWVGGNQLGILVSDSPENLVSGNAFVDNAEQLSYQDNKVLVWDSEEGGNFWNDYVGWDRDGDGIGDRRHLPLDIASYLVQRFPAVRLVMHSPAMALLQSLEDQFPALHPPGIVEPRPLIANPLAGAETGRR